MPNYDLKVEGKKLIITVDLDSDLGPSKSGKTRIIGTTSGAVSIPGKPEVKVNLNVYRDKVK